MLKCGMAELNITPPLGLDMPGQWHNRKASGIKDELYVKALILEDEGLEIVLITLDALAVQKNLADRIKEQIAVSCGIPESNMMVSATHTHTGGPVMDTYSSQACEEYLALLVKKAADAALIAQKKLKPALVGSGLGCERDIAFNRRYFMEDGSVLTNPGRGNPAIKAPAGPIDTDVTVMRIDDAHGNPIGIVTNFACHPDVTGGTEYSADYPGALSRMLKRAFGPDVVSMFLTGACGDINHVDTRPGAVQDKRHYEKMGVILAGEVLKTREKIIVKDTMPLAVKYATVILDARNPSNEDLKWASAVLETSDNKAERNYADTLIRVGQRHLDKIKADVQVVRIGDLAIAGLPGEIFTQLGLEIKKNSPFSHNMVNELANGCYGYIPTTEAFSQGGGDYETRLTTYSRLIPGAGHLLVEKALSLMNDMV